ncbi:MAG TPA: hypothetical protein VJS65_09610 [Verrucomicrobiae bacterium]|nr:hypothetical protein [Verrucomicrobiae bacterium]
MPARPRIQLLPDKKFWSAYLPLCRAVKNPSPKLHKEVYQALISPTGYPHRPWVHREDARVAELYAGSNSQARVAIVELKTPV